MSEGNGAARFDDLRTSVVEQFARVNTLEVDHARLSARMEAVERSLDRLTAAVERLRDEESPRGRREKAATAAQVITVVVMLLSMLLPYLKH